MENTSLSVTSAKCCEISFILICVIFNCYFTNVKNVRCFSFQTECGLDLSQWGPERVIVLMPFKAYNSFCLVLLD